MKLGRHDLDRIDLKVAMSESKTLIGTALFADHADRLRADMAPRVEAAGPAARHLADGLINAIGALSAQVALLEQAAANAKASRAELIAIDKLPFIPQGRAPIPVKHPEQFKLAVDSTDFNGTGFFGRETDGFESWRWLRPDTASTIVLPSLGGGRLVLRVWLKLPFGHTFDTEVVRVRVNSTDILMIPINPPGNRGLFEATIELPIDQGLGTFMLVLESTSYTPTDAERNNETRTLGLGLLAVELERF